MILGIDTSNYKTSAALYNPETGYYKSCGKLLEVPRGSLGLRQSDALFQHVKELPGIIAQALEGTAEGPDKIAYSQRPRNIDTSYMPCFLAGQCVAQSIATACHGELEAFCHQRGHIAAAAFSVGKLELLRQDFLAWHLSGGTTELLLVRPSVSDIIKCEIIGGTTDISAGQVIDRAGVALEMPFPAGAFVEEAALTSKNCNSFTAKSKDGFFSLSGMENKFKDLIAQGFSKGDVAAFVLQSVTATVRYATDRAIKQYGLPILFSGGVSVCSVLQNAFSTYNNVFFAKNGLGGDNALGAAILMSLR